MSTLHTPGPWRLVELPHNEMVSSWHIHVGDHRIPVFPYKRIYSENRTQSGLVVDQKHMADALLMATAPELLEALQKIVATEHERHGYNPVWTDQARAAIAKATS